MTGSGSTLKDLDHDLGIDELCKVVQSLHAVGRIHHGFTSSHYRYFCKKLAEYVLLLYIRPRAISQPAATHIRERFVRRASLSVKVRFVFVFMFRSKGS